MVEKSRWKVHLTVELETVAHTAAVAEELARSAFNKFCPIEPLATMVKVRAKRVRPSSFEELPEYVQQMCNERIQGAIRRYKAELAQYAAKNDAVRRLNTEREQAAYDSESERARRGTGGMGQ